MGYTVEAVDLIDTCTGHAYGAVAEFFGATDCMGLARALYSTEVGGEAVVVSVARVQMPDAAAARGTAGARRPERQRQRERSAARGRPVPGQPGGAVGGGVRQRASGPTVTIVEAAWVAEDAQLGAAELDRMAGEALALEVPPFPGA